jgi:hypothetical protein
MLEQYHDSLYYSSSESEILSRMQSRSYNGIINKLNFPHYSHWLDDNGIIDKLNFPHYSLDDALIKAGIISKE